MKAIVSLIVFSVFVAPSFALEAAGHSRRSMQTQMVASAPRATASTGQLSAMASMSMSNPSDNKSSVRVEPTEPEKPAVDTREAEKKACISNNIGVGNTFVWASRYSNTSNYATMTEDTENPENNTCFVKVGMKSTDSRIDVSDIPTQYYEWGQNITCGAWVDEAKMQQRILDAKKKARVWATVGGAVGGAGVGVGVMELFGNKLIGGKVQGQKALADDELLRSQLLALKKEKPTQYSAFLQSLKELKAECENSIWNTVGKPAECTNLDYDDLIRALEA